MESNDKTLQKSRHSLDSALVTRNNAASSWRPRSFANIASDCLRRIEPMLESVGVQTANTTTNDTNNNINNNNKCLEQSDDDAVELRHPNKVTALQPRVASLKRDKTIKHTVVDVVIVEAKGLPHNPQDGGSHSVYCKFSMGSHSHKSKSVQATRQPQWRERFKLHLSNDQLLHISLWNKGKRKNFMGSCVIDLSSRERERTHDIWQDLDEGYGSVHLSITMCSTRISAESNELVPSIEPNLEDIRSKYAFYNLHPDTTVVGQLHVKVIGAKGLSGKPNAYCTLELDNEKVQTPSASASSEPTWNKTFVFNIYDVASTLEIKVYDRSINSLLYDFLGRVIIPLLRINNGEACWYALKDSCKRKSARGNCPRVRLEMNVFWNPVVASLKLFRPKQVKYITKQPKFDIPLVYKNCKFIKETFDVLYIINECIKSFLEWDDRELSTTILCCWLIFWYYFDPWMTPLLIAALFPVMWFIDHKQNQDMKIQNMDDSKDWDSAEETHNGDTISEKIKGLPEMTLTITNGIEYMVSVAERINNLATFKVPFLTFLSMFLLAISSALLYFVPYKYLMMGFGLYKYGRKRLEPDRVPNNDLLDFISRIPDNKILRDWRQLSVPEPQIPKNNNISTVAKPNCK
ncbi:multiple C2 and transmembrane domain-containing protein isoform X1 [Helicoverpa armigera]|uniref:multiple C2 and transmembrane domain-containing protein isoform X1 n=1 Tax=Helicoverpa armigera TaxID=29058 RepID=UPI003082E98B